MPDNVRLDQQQNRNKHSITTTSAMATFDNPSYFTISGQSPVVTTPTEVAVESIGAKPKRFKSWFKLSKRAFRSKVALNEVDNKFPPSPPPGSPVEPEPPQQTDFAQGGVIYYNFCSSTTTTAAQSTEVVNDDDDVFSDTSTIREIGSTKTLGRRRHSLGSWFRSSLAAVRKHNAIGSSTASGLESHDTVTSSRSAERPSTSSERGLLARNVSTSANCVASSSSSRDATTPKREVSTSGESKASKRSRLPVAAVKSHVELRARARYARQEKLVRDSKAVSTSRIPRAVQSIPQHRNQTASLDRRYTKSTEVLASKSDQAVGVQLEQQQQQQSVTSTVSTTVGEQQQLEKEDSFQQREDTCSTRRKSVSSTTSRQRFVQRSRTIEDRHRTSCCGRMAAAAASSTGSSRSERRRASFDAASPSLSYARNGRKCQKCRDKAEPVSAENVDVVIIFSKNCVVAYQWITYLTEILSKMFCSTNDRPPTRVTSRDVESLVDCSTLPVSGRQQLPTPPDRRFQKTDYQNIVATGQLDAERSARQHAVRKTVATSSLQIVLLSKSLLHHVSLHANDPLGTLLNPKRVLGLVLGIDQDLDITPLHRSALITYEYWPKITMLDQNMESVTEFGKLAQSILCSSQSVTLVEANLQPARFKINPKKLRSGEERVSLILLETVENIQRLATVHIGIDLNKGPVRIEKISWVNPYVANIHVPKMFLERGIIVKVQLKVGNTSWGVRELKCQSKLTEISVLLSKCQLMTTPTEVMCQALNISPVDVDALDKALSASLDKSQVKNVSAFNFGDPDDEHREDEFPTLLHFAARFGFKDMMWALLECLGAVHALHVRNFHGFTPLQLAEIHGHKNVTDVLNGFIQVFEADKLVASEKSTADQAIDKDDYVVMNRSTQDIRLEDYDFVPKPKPVISLAFQDVASTVDDLKHGYTVVLPADRKKGKKVSEDRAIGGDQQQQTSKSTKKHKQTAGFSQDPVWTVRDQSSVDKATLAPTGLPLAVSRGSSPLSNWSSSDRSSVTSHASHDSGTHFESSEERKVNHLTNMMHSDYNVPPPTRFMLASYDVPPAPVPLKKQEDGKGYEDATSIPARPTQASPSVRQKGMPKFPESPWSSPRPPTKFRNGFETIELTPPINQAILGEDLGRIVPIEEPEFMEQRPIQYNSHQAEDATDSDYITMTPITNKRGLPPTNGTTREGVIQHLADSKGSGDYLTTEEINVPELNFASNQRELPYSKIMSNSAYQLPANNLEAQMSGWHSETSLARPIPSPRNRDAGAVTPPVPPRTMKPTRSVRRQ